MFDSSNFQFNSTYFLLFSNNLQIKCRNFQKLKVNYFFQLAWWSERRQLCSRGRERRWAGLLCSRNGRLNTSRKSEEDYFWWKKTNFYFLETNSSARLSLISIRIIFWKCWKIFENLVVHIYEKRFPEYQVSLVYIFVKSGIVRYSIFYWNQYTIYFTADRNKTQNYYLSDHLFVKLEAFGMNWLNETL
jgi:hypothetical protein